MIPRNSTRQFSPSFFFLCRYDDDPPLRRNVSLIGYELITLQFRGLVLSYCDILWQLMRNRDDGNYTISNSTLSECNYISSSDEG